MIEPDELKEAAHSPVIRADPYCRACQGFWGWPSAGGWCRSHEVFVDALYACPDWMLRTFYIEDYEAENDQRET